MSIKQYYILVSCLLFLSCEQRDEAAVQAAIKKQVASNVATFKARRIQQCHKKAMEEAITIADSLMLARALAAKDTSQFIRPTKPTKPMVNMPVQHTPVAPLFEKEGGRR